MTLSDSSLSITQKDPLAVAVAQSDAWSLIPANEPGQPAMVRVGHRGVNPYQQRQWQTYAKSELDAFDARLYPVVTALLSDALSLGSGRIPGDVVRSTVALWRGDTLLLPLDTGSDAEPQAPSGMVHVSQIEHVEQQDKLVRVGCITHVLKQTPCGIDYLSGSFTLLLRIDRHYMDEQYPGWEQRLATAQALGVTELAGYVFNIHTARPLPLGDIAVSSPW